MISHLVLKHYHLTKISNSTKGRGQATPVKSLVLPGMGVDKKLPLRFEATDRIDIMPNKVGQYLEIIQHLGI